MIFDDEITKDFKESLIKNNRKDRNDYVRLFALSLFILIGVICIDYRESHKDCESYVKIIFKD